MLGAFLLPWGLTLGGCKLEPHPCVPHSAVAGGQEGGGLRAQTHTDSVPTCLLPGQGASLSEPQDTLGEMGLLPLGLRGHPGGAPTLTSWGPRVPPTLAPPTPARGHSQHQAENPKERGPTSNPGLLRLHPQSPSRSARLRKALGWGSGSRTGKQSR